MMNRGHSGTRKPGSVQAMAALSSPGTTQQPTSPAAQSTPLASSAADVRPGSARKVPPIGSSSTGSVEEKPSQAPANSSSQLAATSDQLPRKTFGLNKVELDDLLRELRVRLLRLQKVKDFTTEEYKDDLSYLREASTYKTSKSPDRIAVTDLMAELEMYKLFQSIWKQNFPLASLVKDEAETGNLLHYTNMKNIMIAMWNGSDSSDLLCRQIFQFKVYEDCLRYLSDEKLTGADLSVTSAAYCVKGLFGMLHNVVQLITNSRTMYRECHAIETLRKYKACSVDMIKCKADLLLAYIVNETEYEEINSDDKNIQFLLKIMSAALSTQTHHSRRYGFSALELLKGLNLLAANDNNKSRIVSNGGLEAYVKLMQPDCTAVEQSTAAKGIWIMAFKCREEILKEPGCVDALKALVSGGGDDEVREQAEGALWILEVKEQRISHQQQQQPQQQQQQQPRSSKKGRGKQTGKDQHDTDEWFALPVDICKEQAVDTEAGEERPHIFISYQWDCKPTMLQVRDRLREAGFKIWMDVDHMSGSILEAMALAVEKAALVIVCLSQKYKESPNCRTEAEYTFRQRKEIVPLRLQTKYAADGWLGALVGNRLFFDFSQENKFQHSLNALIRELGDRGKISPGTPTIQPVSVPLSDARAPGTPASSHTITAAAAAAAAAAKWSTEDVLKWMDRNKMATLKMKFADFDGAMLVELRCLYQEVPEFYYNTLKTELGLKLADLLKLTKALKELSQLD